MRHFFLLSLTLIHTLTANSRATHPENLSLTSLSSEPSSIIAGKVNAVTGDFVLSDLDMSVPGPEKMTLERSYSSGIDAQGCLGFGWGSNHDHQINLGFIDPDRPDDGRTLSLVGPFGQFYDFGVILTLNHDDQKSLPQPYRKGVCNTSHGIISAQNNPKEVKARSHFRFSFPDGSVLSFGGPITDERPSGNSIVERPIAGGRSISFRNGFHHELYHLEWRGHKLDAKGFKKQPFNLVVAPDHRFTRYEFTTVPNKWDKEKPFHLLTKVERSDAPQVNYGWNLDGLHDHRSYGAIPKIGKIELPDERGLEVHYLSVGINNIAGVETILLSTSPRVGRVARIMQPIGNDKTLLQSYQFRYGKDVNGGCTGVLDALMRLTNYAYNHDQRLIKIIKYLSENDPYSIETLYWGKPEEGEETFIKGRTFGLYGHPLHFCRRYTYDSRGNVRREILYGNLTGQCQAELTVNDQGRPNGSAIESLEKIYEYSKDGFNLLLKDACEGVEKCHSYYPSTNRLIATLHKVRGQTFQRHFYAHDECGQIVLHIEDDGSSDNWQNLENVTHRKIEQIKRRKCYPFNLPESVRECYLEMATGAEKQLIRTEYEYDVQGRVTKQSVYDANDQLFAVEEWDYDLHGNRLHYINPEGAVTRYTYDANDNCLSETGPDPFFSKHYIYDYMNRLISTEYRYEGKSYFEKTTYDLVGNPIQKVNIYGQTTDIQYDTFNRPITTLSPPVTNLEGALYRPTTHTVYNALGHPIEQTNAEGHRTRTAFNLYGSPTHILYADGSEEHFVYDRQGRLLQSVAKNGTTSQFTLDHLGRAVKREVFDPSGTLLFSTESSYDCYNILWETDPMGTKTTYSYDGAGRKITEEKADTLTEFEYNPQGLLFKKTIRSKTNPSDGQVHINEYDVMQRVTAERIETLDHELVTDTSFAYDLMGNKTTIRQETSAGTSSTYIKYGPFNIPLERHDPDGSITFTHHREEGLPIIEVIDPQGFKSIQRLDALDRIIELEKQDPFGETLQKTLFTYDALGKCLETRHIVISSNRPLREVINRTRYDAMGRTVEEIEAFGTSDEKRTSCTYTFSGEVDTVTKPDGTFLVHAYNSLGKLAKLQAPGVDYRYLYDLNGNLIEIENALLDTKTLRSYDRLNRLTEEKLENGLFLSSTHTAAGSLSSLTLPDSSAILYGYKGPLLKSVDRIKQDGSRAYTHLYLTHDLSGRPLTSSLIMDLGLQTTTYTIKGEIASLSSPYYEETLQYDCRGNITNKSSGDASQDFTYDALSQLTSETGTFTSSYQHDSLYNRIEQNGNNFTINTLNQTLDDGRVSYSYDLAGRLIQAGSRTFSYDSLDRLIAVDEKNCKTSYRYDPFNRCIQKTSTIWETTTVENYLYLQQVEIASANAQLQMQTLRILGKGLKAEVGGAVAIEINGTPYAPLHDHLGSIKALVNASGSVAERYQYSAFGEVRILNENRHPLKSSTIGNPWQYCSKRQERNLIFFGLRAYLPSLGKFLTKDPLGSSAGPNPYAFLNNNPLKSIDPFGLKEDSLNLYDRTHDTSSWEYGANRDREARESRKEPSGRTTILSAMGTFWRTLVPIPILQDLGCALFHQLENGCQHRFKPWKATSTTVGSSELDQQQRHIKFILYTGICTSHDEAVAFAIVLSKIFGGENVTVVHNGDHGLVADLAECGCLIVDISLHCTEISYETIKQLINELGGPESGNILKVICFSQGALTFSRGVKNCTPQERAMMHVNTYGPATIMSTEDFLYMKNTISKLDLIPLASPINYLKGFFGFMPEVEFVPAQEHHWGLDHAFMSKTYQKAMTEDARQFMQRYYK